MTDASRTTMEHGDFVEHKLNLGEAGYIRTSYSNKLVLHPPAQNELHDVNTDSPLYQLLDHDAGTVVLAFLHTSDVLALLYLAHNISSQRALAPSSEHMLLNYLRADPPCLGVTRARRADRIAIVEAHVNRLYAAFGNPPPFLPNAWPSAFRVALDYNDNRLNSFSIEDVAFHHYFKVMINNLSTAEWAQGGARILYNAFVIWGRRLNSQAPPHSACIGEWENNIIIDKWGNEFGRIETEWENGTIDRAPYEALAAAEKKALQDESDKWIQYKEALFSSDANVLDGGVSATQLSCLSDSVAIHGLVDVKRGVENNFETRESSTLLSIPAGCFGAGGTDDGRRVLILVSIGGYLRRHTIMKAKKPEEYDEWDDEYKDNSNLNQISLSVNFPGDGAFSSLLSLSYTVRCTPEEPWPENVETHGLTFDEVTANRLEEFACGSARPHTSHSGVLVRTLIVYGAVSDDYHIDGMGSRLALLVLGQQQDALGFPVIMFQTDNIFFHEGEFDDVIMREYQLIDLGSGSFVRDWPNIHQTADNSEVIDEAFMISAEAGVGAFVTLAAQAKSVVEGIVGDGNGFTSLNGVNEKFAGWEVQVNERVFEGGMITAPTPRVVEWYDHV
jgi:hypothetical protein